MSRQLKICFKDANFKRVKRCQESLTQNFCNVDNCDIICVHESEFDNTYVNKYHEKLFILYSGGGINTSSENSRILPIKREISPNDGFITQQEWIEIAEIIEVNEHTNVCSFITLSLGNIDKLLGVFILCQGYLIACLRDLPAKDLDIQSAVSLIGFSLNDLNCTLSSFYLANKDLSSESLLVKELSWWRNCLDDDQENEKEQLETHISRKWSHYKSDGADLVKLIRVIYQRDNPFPGENIRITPRRVARAYCAIYRYLSSR
jgi:hypothetical protein